MTKAETQFQNAIIELALLRGWLYYHPYDSRRSVPGFPDLTLVRDKVIFAELKKPKAKLTEAQQKWHDAINASDNGIAYVWRPEDWDEIERVLK